MIALTRAVVRRWVEALLHIHDTPRRTAAAFALGLFLGFSPFLGLHTALALGLAFVLNLNRVAVLVGVYANLPWIIAAWYGLTTALGAWLMRTHLPHGFRQTMSEIFDLSLYQPHFWQRLWTIVEPLFWPFVVGSLVGAVVVAAAGYWLVLGYLEARHHHMEKHRLKTQHGAHQ